MLSLRKLPDQTQGLLADMVVVICWSGFNIVSRFGAKGFLHQRELTPPFMRYRVTEHQLIVEAPWLVECQGCFANDQHMSELVFEFSGAGANPVQPFGTAAFEKLQVAGVMDHAGGIGVSVTGADVKMVEDHEAGSMR